MHYAMYNEGAMHNELFYYKIYVLLFLYLH